MNYKKGDKKNLENKETKTPEEIIKDLENEKELSYEEQSEKDFHEEHEGDEWEWQ